MFQHQLKILDRLAAEQRARSIDLQTPPAAAYQGRYSGPHLDIARAAAPDDTARPRICSFVSCSRKVAGTYIRYRTKGRLGWRN